VVNRNQWDAEYYHTDMLEVIQKDSGGIFDEKLRLESLFESLPKNESNFGLIHGDVHQGNFHIDEQGSLTLFDFDDCVYHWFLYDIAVVLFAVEEFKLDPGFVFDSFFQGYTQENHLSTEELKRLPGFYNYRKLMAFYFCDVVLKKRELSKEQRAKVLASQKNIADYFDKSLSCPYGTFLTT